MLTANQLVKFCRFTYNSEANRIGDIENNDLFPEPIFTLTDIYNRLDSEHVIKINNFIYSDERTVDQFPALLRTEDKEISIRIFLERKSQYLIKLNLLLDKDNKLESNKDETVELISHLSHDLKGPLASIIGLVSLISMEKQSGTLNNENLEYYLGLINGKANSTIDFIGEILDITKINIDEQTFKEISINQLIRSFISSHRLNALSKKIDVEYRTEVDNDCKININPTEFNRVLSNIYTNAIKFSPENSKLIIQASLTESGSKIEFIDQGQGIPSNKVKKINNNELIVGKTGLRGEKSHGLGFHIIHKIINAHGGIFQVSSKVGEGTRAIIKLYKK